MYNRTELLPSCLIKWRKKICFLFWELHHGRTHSFAWMWYNYITRVYGWLMILLRLLEFGNSVQLLKRHLPCFRALHSKNPFISSQCFFERQQNSLGIFYFPQNVFLSSFSQSTFFQPSKIKTTRNNNNHKSFMYLLQCIFVYIANFPFVLFKKSWTNYQSLRKKD